jgi:dipeptidyl aminopeptidase/acylaminoacyl peptidase
MYLSAGNSRESHVERESMAGMSYIANKKATILQVVTVSAVGLSLFGIAAVGGAVPTPVRAADSSDVQYETTLDYNSTNVLLEEQGFVSSTTYDCNIASLACTPVSNSITNLMPGALADASSYFVNTNYTEAIVTTYIPGSNPTEMLDTISGDTLTPRGTLPALNALITNVMWSSNGNVLIISESDGSTQKYNATTNTLTTLKTSLPGGASWINISPNGRYIAYYIPATVTGLVRTYGVIDTTNDVGYTLPETISYWDLLSEGVRIFAFSPDSTKLLYLDDRSGYQTLYEVNLANLAKEGLTGTQVTTKPYTIADMQWVSNSSIVFAANRSNVMQWSLYRLNLNSYALVHITDWLSVYDAPMEKDGSNIIFQTADANGRLDKIYNSVTGLVSSFNVPGVTQSNPNTATVIKQDGLYGSYTPSPTTATSTLLVWLHGGPDRQTGIEYDSYMSYGGYDWVLHQVNQLGIPVLKLDYPGSIGQGLAFAESIKDNVGVTDASSTMQAISDFATAHGYTHIYVMGNSYGGYLALKLLVSYPNQIDGAYSLSGVTDWASLLTNIPSSIFSIDFNGSPNPLNQMLYNAASVINNLNAITDQKVIITQGNADTEVPYQQSQILDESLKAAGKTDDYTTLDGEDHIYELPSSYTLVCNKTLELVGLPSSSLCTMQ